MDKSFWKDKRVFVTGHTGFKGAWLSLWLHSAGAKLAGYALDPPTDPSFYAQCGIAELMQSTIADVRDRDALCKAVADFRPEIVLHLAAQPIVRESYRTPAETFDVNVMGTVNLLEAVRATDSVRAAVIVTSDKCYENKGAGRAFREGDPMGGNGDPYSSSKGCAELAAESYTNSFFSAGAADSHAAAVASARAGNCIGGGDWAADRLVPDCVRALLKGDSIFIRSPRAVRPWQHTLEPIAGYLMLARALYEKGGGFSGGWNFGPDDSDARTVEWVVQKMCSMWGGGARYDVDAGAHPHEAAFLTLDASKSTRRLGWRPKWDAETALEKVTSWTRAMAAGEDMRAFSLKQIEEYEAAQPLPAPERDDTERELRERAVAAAVEYCSEIHLKRKKEFKPGGRVAYGGRVWDEKEVANLTESTLDFWLTAGRFADEFEKRFAGMIGVRHCSLVNSGSSANLLAFMALTSPKLGDRRIARGDEVITLAAGFPTTVAPIVQHGAVPVFVDVTLPEYNIDCSMLEGALSPRTKAVFAAHTLGNPFNLAAVRAFCDRHGLWLIEDNCDALGSEYNLNGTWGLTGSFGHLSTFSFYPPHHMTMGEGGAVCTNDGLLNRLVESFRDWGRDCWCKPGTDNTCSNRFNGQYGTLPRGYDHKYVYSHFGYNLKVTDMQAAIGCAQLGKLPGFVSARRENWAALRQALDDLSGVFVLPEAEGNSRPSWFGFMLTAREDAPFGREEIVRHLEDNGIQTRMLFAGNLTRHPCFDEMRVSGQGYRICGELKNTDIIAERSFWIGVYPGMTTAMINYMIEKIREKAEGR